MDPLKHQFARKFGRADGHIAVAQTFTNAAAVPGPEAKKG